VAGADVRSPDGLRSRDLRLDRAFERDLKGTAPSYRIAFALLRRCPWSRVGPNRSWSSATERQQEWQQRATGHSVSRRGV